MLRVGSRKKPDPPLNTCFKIFFLHTTVRSDLNIYKAYFYGVLRTKSWDFASMLKLHDTIETWDPMWTWPEF